MTYMSISAKIVALVNDSRLIRYQAALKPHETAARGLFMTPGAHQLCPSSGSSADRRVTADALAAARSQMTDFVAGRDVECQHDFKRLNPPPNEIWELRTHWHPQMRLFGWFACPNVFVVTNGRLRNELRTQQEWNEAIKRATQRRDELFPGQLPFRGTAWCHYVTLNASGEL